MGRVVTFGCPHCGERVEAYVGDASVEIRRTRKPKKAKGARPGAKRAGARPPRWEGVDARRMPVWHDTCDECGAEAVRFTPGGWRHGDPEILGKPGHRVTFKKPKARGPA